MPLLKLISSKSLTRHAAKRFQSTASIKNSIRGQNLSKRYARLESSIRGKNELEEKVDEYQKLSLEPDTTTASPSMNSKNVAEVFRGIAIPVKPTEPASDECCMSGCATCVYELYDESLTAYKESIATVKATLTAMNVPISEWPDALQEGNAIEKDARNVTLSVFEEMERQFAAKRAANAASG